MKFEDRIGQTRNGSI